MLLQLHEKFEYFLLNSEIVFFFNDDGIVDIIFNYLQMNYTRIIYTVHSKLNCIETIFCKYSNK